MSILIKGFEIPTRCAECRLSTVHSFNDRPLCDVLVEYMSYGEWETKRLDNCPLIEVPEPHGRLIEADKLKETLDYYIREAGWSDEINKALSWVKDEFIDSEQAIIPASEEGET